MRRTIQVAILLFLAFAVPLQAMASDVAICDPNDSKVPNRVKEWRTSVNTPDFMGRTDVLINPSLAEITEPNPRYWKCIQAQNKLVDMTAAEKTALDAERVQREQQRQADLAELEQKRQAAIAAFRDWDTLTGAQKLEVLRHVIRFMLLQEKVLASP